MHLKKRRWLTVGAALALVALMPLQQADGQALGDRSDAELIAMGEAYNEALAAAGYDIALAQIEFYTQGPGRPVDGDGTGRVVRILQEQFRWVPGDTRRAAAGNDITFIIDDALDPVHKPSSLGTWPSPEIRSAMATWDANRCLKRVNLLERPSTGADDTLFDEGIFFAPFCLLPGGDLAGFPPIIPGVPSGVFAADIIHAGWYPALCFAPTTLAFSVTFTFIGGDANGDNYLDTALNEVYYNDAFGTIFPGDPWATGGAPLPAIDVETVALHESGHSLGVGHFGPPPTAVMNPTYAGPRQSLFPIDNAGMCTILPQWPRR